MNTAVAYEEQSVNAQSKMNTDALDQILSNLSGNIVTVVNPQSYTPTLTGYKIDASAYKAKVVSCEKGILKLLMDYLSDPHKKVKERAYQFIPVNWIKRVMISKSDKLISL